MKIYMFYTMILFALLSIPLTLLGMETIYLEEINLLEQKEECAICLEEKETILVPCEKLPCLHSFHPKCITGWLNINQSCPICRQKSINPTLQNFHSSVLTYVNTLIENGNNINTLTRYGETALHIAAQYNFSGLIMILLNHGANINAVDSYGYPPLYKAASIGNYELTLLLLQKGALIYVENPLRYTALHKATAKGHIQIINLLLQFQAPIDAQNLDGNTALHRAALYGSTRLINTLLEAGANPLIQNNAGKTPKDLMQLNKKIRLNEINTNF